MAWARKFKKIQTKKLVKSNKSISKKNFREIAFLAFLNFFPSSKIDIRPFLKLQKIDFGQKLLCEIDLFDLKSFFAWTFLIFWPSFQNCIFFKYVVVGIV